MKRIQRSMGAGRAFLSTARGRRMIQRGLWGFGDQALLSATNFATIVLVARVLSAHDFGLYALVYTFLTFMNHMQQALISTPYTMLGAPRSGEDFARFTKSTVWFQVAYSVVSSLIILIVAMIGVRLEWGVAPVLLACVPATIAWQMQEFIRRVLFNRSAVAQVLANDLVSYGGQLGLIVWLWQVDRLTAVSAIMALGGTSLLAAILGLWQIRAYLRAPVSWIEVRDTTIEQWNFGKWLMGGNLASWASGKAYPILAAGLISVAATGAMKAVQTILGPIHILTIAQDSLLGPHASRSYAQGGPQALRKFVTLMQLSLLCTVGTYCLLVSLFAGSLLGRIYGPEYVEFGWLLTIMAFTEALKSLRNPIGMALSAVGETSAIFRIRAFSGVVNLSLGLAAVRYFGYAGIGMGLILNSLTLQLVTWYFYRRKVGGTSHSSWIKRQLQRRQERLKPGSI